MTDYDRVLGRTTENKQHARAKLPPHELSTIKSWLGRRTRRRGMPEIFISYSRKDRDFVDVLRRRFSELGRDTWVDVTDIPPTAKWRSEVLSSIEQVNAFVFVLSPDSIVSRECLREVAHAVKCRATGARTCASLSH